MADRTSDINWLVVIPLLQMGVVLISQIVKDEDLKTAREEYGDYVKVVVDVETGAMTIGGEWHADGEKLLIEGGSKQNNLWGGGVDIKEGKIETIALINLRPNQGNNSQDILDQEARKKFIKMVKAKFNL